jgi:hypothetical protein
VIACTVNDTATERREAQPSVRSSRELAGAGRGPLHGATGSMRFSQ